MIDSHSIVPQNTQLVGNDSIRRVISGIIFRVVSPPSARVRWRVKLGVKRWFEVYSCGGASPSRCRSGR